MKLRQALDTALGEPFDSAALWRALADDAPAPDLELPRTGVSLEAERQLSGAFVRFADGRYGTRSSTLLVARPSRGALDVQMQEKTWLPEGGAQLREERLLWQAVA